MKTVERIFRPLLEPTLEERLRNVGKILHSFSWVEGENIGGLVQKSTYDMRVSFDLTEQELISAPALVSETVRGENIVATLVLRGLTTRRKDAFEIWFRSADNQSEIMVRSGQVEQTPQSPELEFIHLESMEIFFGRLNSLRFSLMERLGLWKPDPDYAKNYSDIERVLVTGSWLADLLDNRTRTYFGTHIQ